MLHRRNAVSLNLDSRILEILKRLRPEDKKKLLKILDELERKESFSGQVDK